MKKQAATLSYISILVMFSIVLLQSCKDTTHEVITTSCVDSKTDSTGFTKELNSIKHFITLERALELTDNYAKNKDSILSGAYGKDNSILPDFETFNLKALDSLFCQEASVGFRIYPGLDENKKIRFVLAGVDANGEDVLVQSRQRKGFFNQKSALSVAGVTAPGDGKNDLLLEAGQRHP